MNLTSDSPYELIPDYGYTRLVDQKYDFTWAIPDFSLCKEETGQTLCSPVFPRGSSKLKWHLAAYPKGLDEEHKDFLSLMIIPAMGNETTVRAKFKISIVDGENEKYSQQGKTISYYKGSPCMGFLKYIELSMLGSSGYLPDDNLTILCELTIEGYGVTGYSNDFLIEPPKCTLSQDFGSFFGNREFGDVTLYVGNKEVVVHKAILAARSTIFADKLKTCNQNRLVITDVRYEELREMLHYIYTGQVQNADILSVTLLEAADKYGLVGLKMICENALFSTLNIDNIPKILAYAKRFNAERLRIRATDFMKAHYNRYPPVSESNQPGSPSATTSSQKDGSFAAARSPPCCPCPSDHTKDYGHSQMITRKYSFTWVIHNFSLYRERDGYFVTSPTFPTKSPQLKWRAMLYPVKSLHGESGIFFYNPRLDLILVSSENEVRAKFVFSILHGNKKHSKYDVATFTRGANFGINEFIELGTLRDQANGFLPKDTLTILCEVTLEGQRVAGYVNEFHIGLPECTLSENFGSLLEKQEFQEFSDATLFTTNKELRVHKAILAARSSVFAAMFMRDAEKRKQNRFGIKDIDCQVLEEMVHYIYTGKSPNVREMAPELLAAADKYDLAGLKRICESALASMLTTENVAEILLLADTNHAEQLKMEAVHFQLSQFRL